MSVAVSPSTRMAPKGRARGAAQPWQPLRVPQAYWSAEKADTIVFGAGHEDLAFEARLGKALESCQALLNGRGPSSTLAEAYARVCENMGIREHPFVARALSQSVESMRISSTTLDSSDIIAIMVAATAAPKLTSLVLWHCDMTELGAAILGRLLPATSITALDVSAQRDATGAARAVGIALSVAGGLQAVACRFIDALDPEPFLRPLAQHGGLRGLSLAHSRLGDDGVIAVARAVAAAGSPLEELDLSSTACGDNGAVALASWLHRRRVATAEERQAHDEAVAAGRRPQPVAEVVGVPGEGKPAKAGAGATPAKPSPPPAKGGGGASSPGMCSRGKVRGLAFSRLLVMPFPLFRALARARRGRDPERESAGALARSGPSSHPGPVAGRGKGARACSGPVAVAGARTPPAARTGRQRDRRRRPQGAADAVTMPGGAPSHVR